MGECPDLDFVAPLALEIWVLAASEEDQHGLQPELGLESLLLIVVLAQVLVTQSSVLWPIYSHQVLEVSGVVSLLQAGSDQRAVPVASVPCSLQLCKNR